MMLTSSEAKPAVDPRANAYPPRRENGGESFRETMPNTEITGIAEEAKVALHPATSTRVFSGRQTYTPG